MLGSGLLQGLAVTAKNLAGSFHDPARYVTTEYPEQRTKLPENYRNFPFLVHDDPADPNGTLRCVACQICEKECPPQCIYIVMERDEKGKALKRPKVFDIDISVCMSCQICVEVCPFDAIKMDQEYEIATRNRFGGLLRHREDLSKSNAYFHQIHPTEAAGVDAALAEQKAKQAAAKAAKAAPAAPKPAAAAAAPTAVPTPATPATAATSANSTPVPSVASHPAPAVPAPVPPVNPPPSA
ncbi:MAG: NuoI/complex I 23 kDa subunit family protein [Opitutaceae bacterium]